MCLILLVLVTCTSDDCFVSLCTKVWGAANRRQSSGNKWYPDGRQHIWWGQSTAQRLLYHQQGHFGNRIWCRRYECTVILSCKKSEGINPKYIVSIRHPRWRLSSHIYTIWFSSDLFETHVFLYSFLISCSPGACFRTQIEMTSPVVRSGDRPSSELFPDIFLPCDRNILLSRDKSSTGQIMKCFTSQKGIIKGWISRKLWRVSLIVSQANNLNKIIEIELIKVIKIIVYVAGESLLLLTAFL